MSEKKSRFLKTLRQLSKYVLTTLLGTLVDCLVLWVMSTFVFADNHVGQYVYSPMVSFECAVFVNFFTAYFYVWKERITVRSISSYFSHFWKYNISCLSAFLLKMVILNVLGATLKWEPVLCNIIALTFSGLLNFFINEFVIFRRKEGIKRTQETQEQ
ncbi:MAG: GtrA family protein [Bacteroidales bacterium]|nr:GtrA family protein [Candidatus Cryptobacteroides aphodequi]